jgi:hypothetical protein
LRTHARARVCVCVADALCPSLYHAHSSSRVTPTPHSSLPAQYEGEVVCGGVGESIFSEETEVLAVLGGTGARAAAASRVLHPCR